MRRTPTDVVDIVLTESGRSKKVTLHSYVATLTEKDGSDVKAIRIDGATNKYDVHMALLDRFPNWNIKTISKLYETDFDIH